jgi:hypothetical protein
MRDDEFKRLVDGEEEERNAIRFGRSRFLRLAAGALFAGAAPLILTETASAAPYPCYGAPACSRCCGCGGGCRAAVCDGSTGAQCWITYANGCNYRCCDWIQPDGSRCITSTRLTPCPRKAPTKATIGGERVVPAGTRP